MLELAFLVLSLGTSVATNTTAVEQSKGPPNFYNLQFVTIVIIAVLIFNLILVWN